MASNGKFHSKAGGAALFVSGVILVPAIRYAVGLITSIMKRSDADSAEDKDDTAVFDHETFEKWVEMRLGGDKQTKFWYSTGELHSYPDGDVLARIEGFDVLYCIRERRVGGVVHQLSRKLFVFRDINTGEVLEKYCNYPVKVVQYPYQKISYSLTNDGKMFTEVMQGSGENRTVLSGTSILPKRVGKLGTAFTCPVFLDIELDSGRYQCYENYDFYLPPSREDSSLRDLFSRKCKEQTQPFCSWVRYGATPPFSKDAVLHIVSWRLDNFSELPESMRTYTETHAPEWKTPPTSLEEVERIAKGTAKRVKVKDSETRKPPTVHANGTDRPQAKGIANGKS